MDPGPAIILGTIGLTMVLFTKTITDFLLKRKMIDKGFVNEDTQAIFKQNVHDNRYTSLKWGIIILFAGLALILMEFLEYDRHGSPMPFGLFAVSVSLGFLLYYFIVRKELKS